ncbi:MAG: hypothetical protein F6K11_00850 [Leptolyngbya sp. SIO3F4]|nr:hypothetical protein [Leptolyngbya sp. SIO3F4]
MQLSLLQPNEIITTPGKCRNDPAEGTVKDDEYNSPEWLWKLGLKVFGIEEYDLDPATNETSTVPAHTKFHLWDDGLTRRWRVPKRKITRGWLNPPFSKNEQFADKLIAEYQEGGLEMIVLDKHDHRVAWWWNLEAVATGLCIIRGYVKFDGHKTPYRFPVSVFYFGLDYEKFKQVFKNYGLCINLEQERNS